MSVWFDCSVVLVAGYWNCCRHNPLQFPTAAEPVFISQRTLFYGVN